MPFFDAPSADAEEFHDQTTHIWYTANDVGGGLELLFDFGIEYDISTLHFWNCTSENFDVDNVSFTFFNGANSEVGNLRQARRSAAHRASARRTSFSTRR